LDPLSLEWLGDVLGGDLGGEGDETAGNTEDVIGDKGLVLGLGDGERREVLDCLDNCCD
jgi:hypothetical protein